MTGLLVDGTPVLISTAPEQLGDSNLEFVWLARAGGAIVLDSLEPSPSTITLQWRGGTGVISKQPWAMSERAIVTADRRGLIVFRRREAPRVTVWTSMSPRTNRQTMCLRDEPCGLGAGSYSNPKFMTGSENVFQAGLSVGLAISMRRYR
jgi:hypothetical protein